MKTLSFKLAGLFIPAVFISLNSFAQKDTSLNQPNQSGSFIALHYIILVPGFTTAAGATFQASIDPGLEQCIVLNLQLSNNQNYIATYEPRTEALTDPAAAGNTTCQVKATIQYFDGLGRPLQTVQVKASSTFRDIVQPIAYDQFGREATKYLPYSPTTDNDGNYKPNAIADQAAFYINPVTAFNAPGVPKIAFPIIETAFEPSPLNRVVEEGAPGDNWQLTGKTGATNPGHTKKTDYESNDASSLTTGSGRWAKLYIVNLDANGKPSLIDNGAYNPNELKVVITKDENWQASDGKMVQWKNTQTRTIKLF